MKEEKKIGLEDILALVGFGVLFAGLCALLGLAGAAVIGGGILFVMGIALAIYKGTR